jgi:hypothetical protein
MIVACDREILPSVIISTRSRQLSLNRRYQHAEEDDLAVEMAAFEKIINAQHPGQLHRGAILPPIMHCFHSLQQNQLQKSLHQNPDTRAFSNQNASYPAAAK